MRSQLHGTHESHFAITPKHNDVSVTTTMIIITRKIMNKNKLIVTKQAKITQSILNGAKWMR